METGFVDVNWRRQRRKFVLFFDGTGNRFSGTDADSNILKILRMLDRSDSSQVHYYQPGIGTYVQSSTFSHTSFITRVNSWIQKSRDSAIGSSFAEHVMGGYQFLMKYYEQGDDIFIFGFSRGAYIARFLAEMLDYVGLLEAGNEEMARFAWKAFARWQRRLDNTEEEKQEKKKMFNYLKAFRDTFSRPVRRIRFLGLFDTVNSVPRFESRWLERSKHPYTAKSSALVIRHAVSIDERRAKFRQDLLSENKPSRTRVPSSHRNNLGVPGPDTEIDKEERELVTRYRRSKGRGRSRSRSRGKSMAQTRHNSRLENISPARSMGAANERTLPSATASTCSLVREPQLDDSDDDSDDDADEALPQDIQEIWFPGCHADIGGGWPLEKGEEIPLSHAPLVWIVREAQKAGLRFDQRKVEEMKCGGNMEYEEEEEEEERPGTALHGTMIPQVHVTTSTPATSRMPSQMPTTPQSKRARLHGHLHTGATKGCMHDVLKLKNGTPTLGVIAWNIMEHLPFRRMDLQSDGSWRSIRWPLPMGEVRDIPNTAIIHSSAIRRMEASESYRPGNLIIGGGGRGVKIAPKKDGIGEWEVLREKGDPVGECMIRKKKPSSSNGVQRNGAGQTVDFEKV